MPPRVSIPLRTRERFEKTGGEFFLQTEQESGGFEGAFHGRHGDHLIQVRHLQSGSVEPGDEFLEGFSFSLLYSNQHVRRVHLTSTVDKMRDEQPPKLFKEVDALGR